MDQSSSTVVLQRRAPAGVVEWIGMLQASKKLVGVQRCVQSRLKVLQM